MKIRIVAVLLVAALATVAFTAVAADTPAVEANIVQLNPAPEMFTFRGPVTVEYQLMIKNPLPDRTITLTRIGLRTQGRDGAYSLRADDPITFTINADSSATLTLSASGRSNGGFMQSSEPVNLLVQLSFDQQDGKSFSKQFVQYLPQDE